MLRILADENVPGPAVAALRAAGHDVAWICDETCGVDDPVITKQAQTDGRLILTFDKDFGELVYKAGVDASAGVILLRITTRSPEATAERLLRELAAHAAELAGHFTVISDRKVRIGKLPRPWRGA